METNEEIQSPRLPDGVIEIADTESQCLYNVGNVWAVEGICQTIYSNVFHATFSSCY